MSQYPRVAIRLPEDTKDQLDALAAITGRRQWQIIDAAIQKYVETLPKQERENLAIVFKMRVDSREGRRKWRAEGREEARAARLAKARAKGPD